MDNLTLAQDECHSFFEEICSYFYCGFFTENGSAFSMKILKIINTEGKHET